MTPRKKVLITGGSRGIGKAVADALQATSQYEIHCPERARLDLNNSESIKRYLQEQSDFDILVNNAGINLLTNIEGVTAENLDPMLAINLVAPLKLIQGVTPHMKAQRWGRIVNVSSMWGVASKEFRSLYSITKFGINGLTKAMSKELGPYNILVNSICPGYTNTELTQKNVSTEDRLQIEKNIPLHRFAEPAEIAGYIQFLVSDNNTYMTGQFVVVDGGFL